MYLRAWRCCIANPKKQFPRSARDDNFCVWETGCFLAKVKRSGLRAQVVANRLGRQFHELRLHETGILSRERYSWLVTRSNGLGSCWMCESYALQRYRQAAGKGWSPTDCASFHVMEAGRAFKRR